MCSNNLNDMDEMIILNWNRICRICLSDESVLYCINNTDEYYDMKFSDMVNYCAELDNSSDDLLPQLICSSCINQLYVALEFKKKCQNAEEVLNKLKPKIKVPDASSQIVRDDKVMDVDFENYIEVEAADIVVFHEEDEDDDIDVINLINGEIDQSDDTISEMDLNINNKDEIELPTVTNNTFSCSICNLEFRTSTELTKHKKTHSNTCWSCFINFETHEEYKEHCEHHNGATCQECGKYFKRKSQLKKHMVTHTKVKKYLCMVCGKTYCSVSALTVHGRIHSGEQRYECNYCNKKFIHWNSMKCHVKSLHTNEKDFECKLCNKRFALKQHLVSHIRCHTGEKRHACTVCEKRFVERNGLKIHMFKHTGEKTIFCKICNKGFVKNSQLKVHMVTHTGERKYSCPNCDKAFTQAHVLRSHMKRHVKNKDIESESIVT